MFLLAMLFIVPSKTWNKFTKAQREIFLLGCINAHEAKYGYRLRNYTITKKGKKVIIDVHGVYREFNI